jgi:cyclophilin family peptidyl-prolyl cis-trans isomerase
LTGIDLSQQVRLNNVVHEPTPSGDEIEDALATRVVLALRDGDIVLKMLPDAPVTAAKFVARVGHGFYDGLIFHRVIPGFVAQGGDPLGLGSGGDKKFVRDEVSTHGHRRGTVGIATEGKDTGDSQFFINLADNSFLDDSYTVFAEIESGIELVDRIQLGARIIRADLF